MFSAVERFLSYRFFFSKRKEGFISINVIFSTVGIALGVATLIIVMSVFNGFRKELIERIMGINSHITIFAREKSLDNYQTLLEELKQFPEITKTNPLINAHGMATKGDIAKAALVKGIEYQDLLKKPLVKNNILTGDIEDFQGKDKIIIGNILASELGVGVGDYITIVSPQFNKTIVGLIPRTKDYQIVATFSVGMHEYDSTTIFIPLKTAQIHFNFKNSVTSIEVETIDVNNTGPVGDNIYFTLYPKGFDISVTDWQRLNKNFFNAIKVERNVMFLILTLIIIVAAFNIISSLIMLVNDKMKHIALLRTMGMSKNSITKIFFINGALIGLIGTGSGVILGTLFSYNINSIKLFLESLTGVSLFDPLIYFLTDLPSEVNITTTIIVAIVSLIICFIAAIIPARKASKFEPVEILRYE